MDGYDEMIVMNDIRFESHCEHHIAPIIGKAHIGYLPDHRVVGISKLARLVDVYARRLQIQEKMTVQIADTLQQVLRPKGVAVVIEAAHQCMTTRGVHKPGAALVTSRMLGAFRDDPTTRREFLAIIGRSTGALPIPNDESRAMVRIENDGDVAVFVIDNPPINAASIGCAAASCVPLRRLQPTMRSLRLIIGGGKTFIAGADLRELASRRRNRGCRQ